MESGVGRWETIPLPTFAFAEFMHLRGLEAPPDLPVVASLREPFAWTEAECARVAHLARPLVSHFHEYLLRGGFPEPALAADLTRCQRLLREDVVDKVLKRDMTALYGVRRPLDLEKIFLYLCYHDGGILDVSTLVKRLDGVSRQTALNYLDLFENTYLLYRLRPYGYGKEILRARYKAYLADPALPGAMMLLGRRLIAEPERLAAAVETAVFKHLFTRWYASTPTFSYWQDRKNRGLEVDLVAEVGDRVVPFEVKYQEAEPGGKRLKGLRLFLEEHGVHEGYMLTRRWNDLAVLHPTSARRGRERERLDARVLAIPAPLVCWWLSVRRFVGGFTRSWISRTNRDRSFTTAADPIPEAGRPGEGGT